jgi:AAA domain-containing protein
VGDIAKVVDWFQNERGIDRATLTAFKVEYTGDKVLLPYPNGKKERPDPTRPLRENERRFYFEGGKTPELFLAPDNPTTGTAFLVEGETDAMRLWQTIRNAGGSEAVFGIGGIDTWRDEFATRYLGNYDRVVTILDNDSDYMVVEQVDRVWRRIRGSLGQSVKRVRLPGDVKDVCEFFDRYDLEHLIALTQMRGVSRFKPLDLTMPPPPTRWFMDGWFAMGDVVVVAGIGGLGKSWLTMALTVAALGGHPECLGVPILEHGPVLYVDEENPQDVVYDRLLKLGFDPMTSSGDLRYLWNQGIKLDRNPDALIEEALDFRPTFIALDSLTRLHSKEENASGDIAPLMNNAIKPLARDVGAAVALIHHHDKNAGAPRGSTDIVNSADAVIECYGLGEANPTKFRMRLTKSRRVVTGKEIIVGINDQPDGSVRLETNVSREFSF